MSCGEESMLHGHPCLGKAQCTTVYLCTIEDGRCDGGATCSRCLSDQFADMEQEDMEDYWNRYEASHY